MMIAIRSNYDFDISSRKERAAISYSSWVYDIFLGPSVEDNGQIHLKRVRDSKLRLRSVVRSAPIFHMNILDSG